VGTDARFAAIPLQVADAAVLRPGRAVTLLDGAGRRTAAKTQTEAMICALFVLSWCLVPAGV